MWHDCLGIVNRRDKVMLSVLLNPTYRQLFMAQVLALLGTGLATVALGLLAYEMAGAEAGAVLGTALAIKMIAYVGVAPIAAAFANNFPRRTLLVALDLVRALTAALLPFVSEIWQIYALIFILQAASASFTPTFQATIPDILPDEKEYTKALSLSRLAYDLESVVSPMLAAALLVVISSHTLFAGTVIGFLASAALVLSTVLPTPKKAIQQEGFVGRTTKGARIYLSTPRLRGLLSVNLAAAAASAMVIVNTVVIVQSILRLDQRSTAFALAAFGGGSMLAALTLPKLLESTADRTVMLIGSAMLAAGLCAGAVLTGYASLLLLWFWLGIGYSMAQTPSGRLLRRSSTAEDRPALFAAQFALSHACWLLTYPIAGWLGAKLGMEAAFVVLAAIAIAAILSALYFWPSQDFDVLEHGHPNLPSGHEHLSDAGEDGVHAHTFVIDSYHPDWPDGARAK